MVASGRVSRLPAAGFSEVLVVPVRLEVVSLLWRIVKVPLWVLYGAVALVTSPIWVYGLARHFSRQD